MNCAGQQRLQVRYREGRNNIPAFAGIKLSYKDFARLVKPKVIKMVS